MEKVTLRNGRGFKDSINCWRTINGATYEAWLSYPSKERMDAYRAAGVRCRRFGVELFVHHKDTLLASDIDSRNA